MRVTALDSLRGLVMVLMALDHVRDFFSNHDGDPTAPSSTTLAMFFTRWITHFCAPVFVLLAGTGTWLYGRRGRSTAEVSRYLWTRGLWLVFLEFTLVRWGWQFGVGGSFFVGQVIWALGMSMLCLSVFVYLSWRWNVGIGLLQILMHNASDGFGSGGAGVWGGLWTVLHGGGRVALGDGWFFFALYPLIPWIGVMQVGYALGTLYDRDTGERVRWLWRLGAGMVVAFVVLRAVNVFGDPEPWSLQTAGWRTALSFLNCTKYPPSLMFLLMTVGPALMVLAIFEQASSRIPAWLGVFGRVPLFYYLLHLYAVHLGAGVAGWLRGRPADAAWILGGGFFSEGRPEGYGFDLPGVYLAWVLIVAALYPLCAGYDRFKRRQRHPVWGYL